MTPLIILLICCQLIIGIMKAIADITEHRDNWRVSVFSRYDIQSFFGAKDHTWTRKYSIPKPFRNILVGTSDIWHLSNTMRTLFWSLYAMLSYLLGTITLSYPLVILILLGGFLNRPFFSVFYLKILRL